jgi:hypothetical protein
VEESLRAHVRFATFRAGALALATLSVVACTADTPPTTDVAEQEAINPPLPSNLTLILNAKTTLTIAPFAQVAGDVGSSGLRGSVLFDVSSSQGCCGRNVFANTVTVNVGASVGNVFGNDITVNGTAAQQLLGLDPTALPPVPAVTPSTPGTTNLSVAANQAKQACPGQYGAITLGSNSTLNLNGGVYQVTRLTLADGARLEPSEPVVILVTGAMTTGIGAIIRPSAQSINPMTAADIRIEVGTSITLGESNQVRAHLLASNGKLTTGRSTSLVGAGWAKIINIGTQSFISGEGTFSAQPPSVPPPCNDNNACTADTCVVSGALAFCRNAPVPSSTSCEDDNSCNGVELCNASGQCEPGTPLGRGTSCTDENACNGDETCNGTGTCLDGTPPVVNDGNVCTADSCDPDTGVSNVPVPDGTSCSGVGVCEAGTCSIEGTVFSEDFVQFESAPAQCNSWNDFTDNRLVQGEYSSITMSGTFDPNGITCSDPAVATQLCQAMHNHSFTSAFCDGHVWNVGQCGGTELSLDFTACSCTFGYTVRPCTGTSWGGINTATCGAQNQNMTVICN